MTTDAYACPHCGATFTQAGAHRQHTNRCVFRPGVEEIVRRALEDPDHPGVALSVNRYCDRAPEYGAPAETTLRAAWGGWPAICARVGLRPGQASGPKRGFRQAAVQREAQAIADVAAAVEADAEVCAWVWGRGLTVLDTPRVLPDGRLAWMVR